MLPKKQRLTRLEIEKLKESGQLFSGKFLGLIFQPFNFSKFSLIISNKISPSAVIRNRFKRIFYKAIKEITFSKKGFYLFLAKKKLLHASKKEIKEDILTLISQIK